MAEHAGEGRRRRHRSRAEANRLAAEYEASGLSRREFCEQRQLPLKTMARYLARFRRERGERPEQRWVPVELSHPNEGACGLAITLANGRRIEVRHGFNAETLQHLVRVLEGC